MKRFALTYPVFPILQVPLAKLANGKDWIYETEKLFNDVASALPRIEDIENSLDDE